MLMLPPAPLEMVIPGLGPAFAIGSLLIVSVRFIPLEPSTLTLGFSEVPAAVALSGRLPALLPPPTEEGDTERLRPPAAAVAFILFLWFAVVACGPESGSHTLLGGLRHLACEPLGSVATAASDVSVRIVCIVRLKGVGPSLLM